MAHSGYVGSKRPRSVTLEEDSDDGIEQWVANADGGFSLVYTPTLDLPALKRVHMGLDQLGLSTASPQHEAQARVAPEASMAPMDDDEEDSDEDDSEDDEACQDELHPALRGGAASTTWSPNPNGHAAPT
jgi:hypothetical protein|mmetsp:Transcript_42648/g.96432  ORF Transcript_42648/g.96432 Transcript_42648/m.96432 type:complete len:130 (-) Transcript_42648:737-1126(-)